MTHVEVELNSLENRLEALKARLLMLQSSQDVRRKMPLRLAVLEDEVAVTESQIKRIKQYWRL